MYDQITTRLRCRSTSSRGKIARMTDHRQRSARTAELVRQLQAVVTELEEMHPGRKFPLDGHLVGSIGEAAAEALFQVTLVRASTAGYDAVTPDGRKVEVKATYGNRSVGVRATSGVHADLLIVLRLSRDPEVAHEVIYNGPLEPALEVVGRAQSNGQVPMRLSRLREANQKVASADRVPERQH